MTVNHEPFNKIPPYELPTGDFLEVYEGLIGMRNKIPFYINKRYIKKARTCALDQIPFVYIIEITIENGRDETNFMTRPIRPTIEGSPTQLLADWLNYQRR